jgi:glycogen debranching enzyme
MSKRRIAILGSTGSIGQSALSVVDAHADRLSVVALAAGENSDLLAEQISKYRPKIASMASGAAVDRLKQAGSHNVRIAASGRDGLVEVGRVADATRIARAMLEAAVEFGYQLPEAFAGFSRDEVPFPVPYPTATRPQAWAAGTPILLLQVLLGLHPDPRRQVLESREMPPLPRWLGAPSLTGIRAFDRAWSVRAEDGAVVVETGDL